MTARRSNARSTRRRSSHLVLVQTHPTRPPLHRRLLRMLPKAGIAIACSLALLAIAAIYVMRLSGPHRTAQAAQPHEAESAGRGQKLASAQHHVLMARVN